MTEQELAGILRREYFHLFRFQMLGATTYVAECTDGTNRNIYRITRTDTVLDVQGPEVRFVEMLRGLLQPTEQVSTPKPQPKRRRKHGTQEDHGGA